MSASPAGPPSGPASTTPNGGPIAPQRRKKTSTNPFHSKKPLRKPTKPAGTESTTNGANIPSQTKFSHPPIAAATTAQPDTEDDPSTYSEYPLIATRKALLDGLRFHAMRLSASNEEVNPYNPEQFVPPLRLHRRFPRDTLNQGPPAGNGVDETERKNDEIRKAERQRQREENQKQIAPVGDKSSQTKKRPQFKKKVEDVYNPQDTPEAQKRARLRYEEGRPWHLEDFEGKNTYVGSYEAPLSETHAMFVVESSGNFRMVPLEKWYRFTATGRYKTMDLDEAEKHMSKKIKDSRWFLDNNTSGNLRQRMEIERQQRLQRGRVGMRGESGRVKNEDDDGERLDMANDMDEIDFEAEDEFQDDDEGKLFLGDEDEVKESEKKIRQEMLGANVFAGTGVKDEKDWDAEEEREKREADDERRKAKKLRKNLIKRERKYEYESESDHPYSEESESEDSDAERQRQEEEKKKEEEALKVNGDTVPSGASSVGTNTPASRSEKHGDPSRLAASAAGNSLKRPGSPNLSEASGSESTKKRQKKDANGTASRAMSPSADGRSLSPGAIPARKHLRGGAAGSGSDTEASGAEGRRPKIRLHKSPGASPVPSRPMSRAGSPVPADAAGGGPQTMPKIEDIRAAIPPEGISIRDLIKRFRSQISNSAEAKTAFIGLVRQVGRNSTADKGLIVQK